MVASAWTSRTEEGKRGGWFDWLIIKSQVPPRPCLKNKVESCCRMLPSWHSGMNMHAHTLTYTYKVILQFIVAFKFYVVWVFCTLVSLSSLECLQSPEEGTESPGTRYRGLWVLETEPGPLYQLPMLLATVPTLQAPNSTIPKLPVWDR